LFLEEEENDYYYYFGLSFISNNEDYGSGRPAAIAYSI
jgi:hypothetical protein